MDERLDEVNRVLVETAQAMGIGQFGLDLRSPSRKGRQIEVDEAVKVFFHGAVLPLNIPANIIPVTKDRNGLASVFGEVDLIEGMRFYRVELLGERNIWIGGWKLRREEFDRDMDSQVILERGRRFLRGFSWIGARVLKGPTLIRLEEDLERVVS